MATSQPPFPQISADASRATECEVIVVVGHKADLASAFDSEPVRALRRPQQSRINLKLFR